MSVDEARRLLLHDAARAAWGAEAALVLMEMLAPTGWAGVATKRDLDALEERTDARLARIDARFDAVDARFAQVDARFDAVDARFETFEARLDATLEAGFRRMIQWNVAMLVAGVGAITAIVRLG
jgi:hypothetical protein